MTRTRPKKKTVRGFCLLSVSLSRPKRTRRTEKREDLMEMSLARISVVSVSGFNLLSCDVVRIDFGWIIIVLFYDVISRHLSEISMTGWRLVHRVSDGSPKGCRHHERKILSICVYYRHGGLYHSLQCRPTLSQRSHFLPHRINFIASEESNKS